MAQTDPLSTPDSRPNPTATPPVAALPQQTAEQRVLLLNALLLAAAWLAAWAVYSPVIGSGWFCDDLTHVANDPRLGRLELFLPAHWNDPPPPIENARDESVVLQSYDKPLIADRYLWHLSFALEKRGWGADYSPAAAHGVNLLLHLACIGALFWALSRLLALYLDEKAHPAWKALPGAAALIFAVHPWAAEPVCYVSARNASMGALFVLLGTGLWAGALQAGLSGVKRALFALGALVCAVAAFGCKENFVTALAGYLLVSWPVLLRPSKGPFLSSRRAKAFGLLACALMLGVVWIGIHVSERAAGLWAQVGVAGWRYFFDVQNPLLLQTLFDQLPVQRLALEANHPNWTAVACVAALALNAALVLLGTLGGRRWPLLLGLGWFYLHLAPTNSFLPRPDFLAARNVYLPVAGSATLLAGLAVWGFVRLAAALERRTQAGPNVQVKWLALAPAVIFWIFWAASARSWAQSFCTPEQLWARTAAVAPDHATVRINLACAILNRRAPQPAQASDRVEAEQQIQAALAAEESTTMRYQGERPRAVRQSLALRLLGQIRYDDGNFAGAEKFLRQSWAAMPSVVTWVRWAGACLDGDLAATLPDVLAVGQQRWPEAWWPKAARGLGKGGPADQRQQDLAAAEQAPNATVPELRALQRLAIFDLAQGQPAGIRAAKLADRLKRLGLSPQDIARLKFAPPPAEDAQEDKGGCPGP